MSDSGHPKSIIVSASFTAEPAAPAIAFWETYFGQSFSVEFAAYGQIFQELINQTSSSNRPGARIVLCVRWSDLASTPSQTVSVAQDLCDAIRSVNSSTPILVISCPSQDGDAPEADRLLADLVSETSNTTLIKFEDALRQYRVGDAYDPHTDKEAYIPYTDCGFAVLGTLIARWSLALEQNSKIKLVATDCDNTLWRGIVGEDGIDGIDITPAHSALHQELSRQAKAGRMLALLSKNNEEDVLNVFSQRADMALSLEDILAKRINWDEKADNLPQIIQSIGVGLDTALFIDDSVVECGYMRAQIPDVWTINTPVEPENLAAFVEHCWLFDTIQCTNEDSKRLQMYRDEATRNIEKQTASSLKDFIDSLNLQIDITPATPADLPRLAQLTQRTNQFNINLRRLDEGQLRNSCDEDALYTVKVRDRFGDYGLVGQMRAKLHNDTMFVDLFTLSCRALGRGVEHQMLAFLGRMAQAHNAKCVEIEYIEGARNQPAAAFLRHTFSIKDPLGPQRNLCADTDKIASLRFDPDLSATPQSAGARPKPANDVETSNAQRSIKYERIARELNSGAAILAEIAKQIRPRPDLTEEYVSPAPGMERELAAIWEDVLRLGPVGANDRFTALGGKSIHLVRIHGLIRSKLNIEIELTSLFQTGTVRLLAARVNEDQSAENDGRAEKMRGARHRNAQRAKRRRVQ